MSKAGDSNGNSNSGLEALRRVNSAGKIPVRLTLAQTSLSSAIPPQPQHVLLSRQTFLHIGLESAVRKLHEYALPTLSFVGNNNNNSSSSSSNNNNNSSSGRSSGKTIVVVQEDDDEPATKDETGESSSDNSSNGNSNGNNIDGKGEESSSGDGDDRSSVPESKKPPPYPVCWFEDVATEQPLRWQYFVGVLFDSLQQHRPALAPNPSQKQQSHPNNKNNQSKDPNSGTDKSVASSSPSPSSSPQILPWEIRLHFQSYPSKKLLELNSVGGVLETVRMIFQNSLKQGFVIRYGNSKEALNLSKHSHDAIWEGISTNNYEKIAPVVYRDDEFDTTTTTAAATNTKGGGVPENKPNDENEATKQQNDNVHGSNDTEKCKKDETPGQPVALDDPTKETKAEEETGATNVDGHQHSKNKNHNSTNNNNNNNLVMVPVRLSVDPTKPMIQKRCDGGSAVSKATLGSLLLEWVPSHFEQRIINVVNASETTTADNQNQNQTTDENDELNNNPESSSSDERGEIRPRGRDITWRVAGLMPPLSTPLLDLWLTLRHPDNFLYVSLSVERR
jgi:hypothetical protein